MVRRKRYAWLVLTFGAALLAFVLFRLVARASAPTNGQVGYWAFDEGSGSTALDSSGGGDSGAFIGNPGPSWTAGIFGDALTFTNTSSYVAIPLPSQFNFSQGTISFWYKPNYNTNNTAGVGHDLITVSGSDGNPNGLGAISIFNNQGYQPMRVNNAAAPSALLSYTQLSSGIWYQVAYTWNSASGTQVYYLDGAADTAASGTWSVNTSPTTVYVGGEPFYGNDANGTIDDLRIYNRPLSPSEIQSVYINTSTSVAPPPPATPPPPAVPPPSTISSIPWTLQPTAKGWQWVSPTGSVLPKYLAVSLVDTTFLNGGVIGSKYASTAAWAAAQNARLQQWGFNAAGQYSYAYLANMPSGGVPYAVVDQVSSWVTRDSMPWHVKNIYQDPGSVQVCSQVNYYGNQVDVFDPNVKADFIQAITQHSGMIGSLSNKILWIPEEGDDLFGLDNTDHADLGFMIATTDPMQMSDGSGYAYPDKTLYAKLALRDYLQKIYGTIGTLNAAWGTNYSTWDTSDPVGVAGIALGTYNSYGKGTGFLDENGAHIVSSAAQADCDVTTLDHWSAKPQIQSDVDAFAVFFAQTYGQDLSSALTAVVPVHPPIFLPLYDGPSNIISALAPYFDGFWVSIGNNPVSDLSRIIAATDGKPVILADYAEANANSPESSRS